MSLYTASFTAGPLLTDETTAVVLFLLENNWSVDDFPIETAQHLKVNAQASRKRKYREVRNRIDAVPREYWEFFAELTTRDEKNAFLYFVCMKYYPLIRDFHFEVILNKWRMLDTDIAPENVAKFLIKASNRHTEIDEWTESTLKKIGQVVMLMLKEVGIVLKNKMRLIFLPDKFWLFFIQQGEGWFLEAMFLSREQRDYLYKKAGL